MAGKPIAVIGAGGHGRVVMHALRSIGRQVVCLTDRLPKEFPDGVDGTLVTTDDRLLDRYRSDDVELAIGVGSVGPVGTGHVRRRIVERMATHGYTFPSVVHNSAWVADSAILGQGVQIHAGAVVQPGVIIEEFAIVNTGATVDHDCHLGAYVHAAPGATLSGDVVVAEGAHVGTGASVIQGIRVGAEAMVAAGAVVVRDVDAAERVAGVPARRFNQ